MGERAHSETSRDCWCQPVVEHLCHECYARLPARGGCWKCGGSGWADCDVGDACTDNHVVAHRYPKGTPGACYFLLESDDA